MAKQIQKAHRLGLIFAHINSDELIALAESGAGGSLSVDDTFPVGMDLVKELRKSAGIPDTEEMSDTAEAQQRNALLNDAGEILAGSSVVKIDGKETDGMTWFLSKSGGGKKSTLREFAEKFDALPEAQRVKRGMEIKFPPAMSAAEKGRKSVKATDFLSSLILNLKEKRKETASAPESTPESTPEVVPTSAARASRKGNK